MATLEFINTFRKNYERSRNGNLRCFPSCHNGTHYKQSFCGSTIQMQVRVPEESKHIFVYGEFTPAGQPLRKTTGTSFPPESQKLVRDEDQEGSFYVAVRAHSFDAPSSSGQDPPADLDQATSRQGCRYVIIPKRKWHLRLEKGVRQYCFAVYLVVDAKVQAVIQTVPFDVRPSRDTTVARSLGKAASKAQVKKEEGSKSSAVVLKEDLSRTSSPASLPHAAPHNMPVLQSKDSAASMSSDVSWTGSSPLKQNHLPSMTRQHFLNPPAQLQSVSQPTPLNLSMPAQMQFQGMSTPSMMPSAYAVNPTMMTMNNVQWLQMSMAMPQQQHQYAMPQQQHAGPPGMLLSVPPKYHGQHQVPASWTQQQRQQMMSIPMNGIKRSRMAEQ